MEGGWRENRILLHLLSYFGHGWTSFDPESNLSFNDSTLITVFPNCYKLLEREETLEQTNQEARKGITKKKGRGQDESKGNKKGRKRKDGEMDRNEKKLKGQKMRREKEGKRKKYGGGERRRGETRSRYMEKEPAG